MVALTTIYHHFSLSSWRSPLLLGFCVKWEWTKISNCLNQDVSFNSFLFADTILLDCGYAVRHKGSSFQKNFVTRYFEASLLSIVSGAIMYKCTQWERHVCTTSEQWSGLALLGRSIILASTKCFLPSVAPSDNSQFYNLLPTAVKTMLSETICFPTALHLRTLFITSL